MKKSLFTIALAVATMVPVFGAQASAAPAKPDATSTSKPAASAATTTTKKHHKKVVNKNTAKPSNAAKPAASTTPAKPAGSSK